MTELYDHIYRCNVYLREALPRAREEDEKGRLRLNSYSTECGTMGCLAYHYAGAMGELHLLREPPDTTLNDQIIGWLKHDKHLSLFEEKGFTFDGTGAFGGSRVPLDYRETKVRQRLAEYESELEPRP